MFGMDPESIVSIDTKITTMDPRLVTNLCVVCIFVTEFQGMMQPPDYMVHHIVIEGCNESHISFGGFSSDDEYYV